MTDYRGQNSLRQRRLFQFTQPVALIFIVSCAMQGMVVYIKDKSPALSRA